MTFWHLLSCQCRLAPDLRPSNRVRKRFSLPNNSHLLLILCHFLYPRPTILIFSHLTAFSLSLPNNSHLFLIILPFSLSPSNNSHLLLIILQFSLSLPSYSYLFPISLPLSSRLLNVFRNKAPIGELAAFLLANFTSNSPHIFPSPASQA